MAHILLIIWCIGDILALCTNDKRITISERGVMEEILKTVDEEYSQTLQQSDFPATKFFAYLSKGTTFFHNREFDKAISEWEKAAGLQLDAKSIKGMPGGVSFRGSLNDVPLVVFLYALCVNAQTGVAIISDEYVYKEVFFKDGLVVFARTSKSEERIGNFLLKSGRMSPSHLEAVAAQAKKEGVKLGRYLVMQGLFSEEEIREVLAFQIKAILSDLFSWQEGDFYFSDHEVDEEDVVVNYTPLEVALFAARRAFDFSTFRTMIPHNKVIFRASPHIAKDKAKAIEELGANEKFIFSLIDGSRNVDQLIRFSGDDELSIINILYRLVLMGFIKRTRDIGIYEDKEFAEISTFLMTLFRVFRMVVDGLSKELGAKAKDILNKAKEGLEEDYRKIFHGIAMNGSVPLDTNTILKNLSLYYPDPSDRLIFIDCFYALIKGTMEEMNRILGKPLTKNVVSEIEKIRLDIINFYGDSPTKKKVVEALDDIMTQFSM